MAITGTVPGRASRRARRRPGRDGEPRYRRPGAAAGGSLDVHAPEGAAHARTSSWSTPRGFERMIDLFAENLERYLARRAAPRRRRRSTRATEWRERPDRVPSSSAPGSVRASTSRRCAPRASTWSLVVGPTPDRTQRRADRLDVPAASRPRRGALDPGRRQRSRSRRRPTTHAALALEAAGANRHVLCEKPFALDAAEARAMLDAAATAGVVAPGRSRVPLGDRPGDRGSRHRRRRHRRTALRHASCRTCRSSPTRTPRIPSWWFDAAAGGGWLGASGSHVVDQVRVWLGEFDDGERARSNVVSARDRRRRGHVHGPLPPALRRGRGAPADRQRRGAR